MEIDVKKMMQEGMAKKPANVWPVYHTGESLDRSKYVTSSEIGQCERKIKFDKAALAASGYSPEKGTTQVAKGWGMMERGHVIEEWLVKTLLRGNDNRHRLILTGKDQRSFLYRNQSGTPDGVFLIDQDKFKTLEIKSIDPRTNRSGLPKIEHVKQVTQNCDLVEIALARVCVGTILVYIDASDYERLDVFNIPFDHELAQTLEQRAERIMNAVTAAELDPEGVYSGKCGYCSHTAQCNALMRKNVKEKTRNDFREKAAKLFGQSQISAG